MDTADQESDKRNRQVEASTSWAHKTASGKARESGIFSQN